MTKKSLDLDFSDISGPNRPQSPKKKEFNKSKLPTGIILDIIEKGEIVEKDLAFCTSEQFIEWCSIVFPGVKITIKEVIGISAKKKIFDTILNFSQIELYSPKKAKERYVH